jgi:predicted GNAT family acetyltransferase
VQKDFPLKEIKRLNMNDRLLFRLAKKSDLECLVEFNYKMALETEDKKLDRSYLQQGVLSVLNDTNKGFYFVAEHDTNGVIASMMITKEWSDWRNGHFWWVQSVFVKKDYRQQGVYRSLYKKVKCLAKENSNCCGLRLYVEKENLIAQRAYFALGMKETYYKLFEEEI